VRLSLLLVTALAAALITVPGAVARGALPAPAPCRGCTHPEPGTSWQWQLTGRIDEHVDAALFDVDLFDTPAAVVRSLHDRGRRVVCYVSAGTWESWRPDRGRFAASLRGRAVEGWPGERWLDVRRIAALAPVLRARLDLCRRKGFDGVELDNVDGYANATGFPLTARDQLAFNVWLANEAHQRGLSVGLKNDLEQVPQLLRYFDWALVEECFEHDECELARPFVRAGKAVLAVEYRLPLERFCARARALGFSALRKRPALGAWRLAC
jgi:hypothetical protein